MALRFGPLKIPWLGKSSQDDPYWEFFINTPPADFANTVIEMIRNAPEGSVFPNKVELHTPEITSTHVKEMARYLGADLVGVANVISEEAIGPSLSTPEAARASSASSPAAEFYPFAVVCALRAAYDPRKARGIGGQVPVQNGLFVTFVLSAWIRELGFRATVKRHRNAESVAAAAGLGRLDSDGKLVTPKFGTRVYVADIIWTDLPLAPDGELAISDFRSQIAE